MSENREQREHVRKVRAWAREVQVRALAAAVTAFAERADFIDGEPPCVCPACGALVLWSSRERHVQWHAQLAAGVHPHVPEWAPIDAQARGVPGGP